MIGHLTLGWNKPVLWKTLQPAIFDCSFVSSFLQHHHTHFASVSCDQTCSKVIRNDNKEQVHLSLLRGWSVGILFSAFHKDCLICTVLHCPGQAYSRCQKSHTSSLLRGWSVGMPDLHSKWQKFSCTSVTYHIRKLSRRNNFVKFWGFVANWESFLCEIWGHDILGITSEQSAKSFSAEIVF